MAVWDSLNYCIASCVAKIVIQVNNIVLIVNGSFQVYLEIVFVLTYALFWNSSSYRRRLPSRIKQSFESSFVEIVL